MFTLKKIAAALVLPPAGLVLVALAGLWISRKHPRTGRAIAAFALLSLLALSMPPVADALLRSLEPGPPVSGADLKRAQAIVVLGAGTYFAAPEYGSDTVPGVSLERLRYGVTLQKRSSLPILVTGGSPFGGRPEAESMKEAIERDFHGKVRWVERESRDTRENALYSARMLKNAGVTRVALVSHARHLKRASGNFEAQGLEVIAAPMGYSTQAPDLLPRFLPSAAALRSSSRALREWLAIAVQRAGN